ncbi:RHS repeat domain-containing protein [Amycolatopsis albispora]|uniref:VWFD domain-containing protein n=1 Tax=Amycolatopsis albispora TaxID=1804986 RepID=A0A344L5F4_9PSEU|nr:RHS repeat-associated core domain-containing protein [Amycolatopsis albispora]AXB43278.1 hypothetical protein A4R43_12535 [Amycolatopsis albispora]
MIAGAVALALVAGVLVVVWRSAGNSGTTAPQPCPDLSAVPCVPDAPLTTVPLAGGRLALVHAGDRLDGGPVQQATWHGWTLTDRHTYLPEQRLLVLGDGRTRTVEAVARTAAGAQSLVIGSEDGREVYEFDVRGRHLRTVAAVTGAPVRAFGYDDGGRLNGITTATGGEIGLHYGAEGPAPTSITVDESEIGLVAEPDGRLLAVTDVDGANWLFGYTETARLASVTGPAGGTTRYEYDGARLAKVRNPGGGSLRYEAVDAGLTITADTGDRVEYRSERADDGTIRRSFSQTGAGSVTETIEPGGDRRIEPGDGTVVELGVTNDPRFGASMPVIARKSVTPPGGAPRETRFDRTAVLADQADPLSVTTLHEEDTDAGKWDYQAATRTLTATSLAGRVTTTRFDEQGRAAATQQPGLPAAEYGYDQRALTSVALGDRTWRHRYDQQTGTLSTEDPAGTGSVVLDPAGRVVERVLGDGAPTVSGYDQAGRVTSTSTPRRAQHVNTWTAAGTLASYTPPGEPVEDLQLLSDALGRPTALNAGGERQYEIGYDAGAISVRAPGFGLSVERTDAGQIRSAAVEGGVKTDYGYHGDRLVKETLSGPVQAEVSASYADTGRLAAVRVGPEANLAVAHDADGLLTRFGPVELRRDPASGLVRQYAAGPVTVAAEHNQYGQLTRRTVSGQHGEIASLAFERDAAGRVTKAVERTRQGNRTETFGYDAQRRLTGPAYDANGNPASIGGKPATYDERDRLRALGSAALSYDKTGRLVSITDGAARTGYGWDPLGRLTSATPAGGKKLDYLVDAQGRRIAKLADGRIVAAWVYLDSVRPIAELDATGKVAATFAYDDAGQLIGMTRDGKDHVIVTDQRGSPVLVVDAATGEAAQRMAYDAAGNVVEDTNPGLQPFGLAGGLYDADTKLVHFGSREYSPALGRWLAPDPQGFEAGDANLYRYALGDPVNLTDPTGGSVGTIGVCGMVGAALIAGLSLGVCFQVFSDGTIGFYKAGGPSAGVQGGLSAGAGVNLGWLPTPANGVDPVGSQAFEGWSNGIAAGAGPWGAGVSWPPEGITGYTGINVGGGKSWGGGMGIAVTGTGAECLYCTGPVGAMIARALVDAWLATTFPGQHLSLPKSWAEAGQRLAAMFGEPHLRTSRGMYDFMGVGEFVAATDGSGTFEVQVRQRPIPGGSVPASMITALAATVDGDRVGIYRSERGNRVLVNGEPVPAATRSLALPRGGALRLTGEAWTIKWADGSIVEVQEDGPAQSVGFAAAPARAGKLTGLLGTAGGKLVKPDGTEIDTTNWPPSFDAVHRDFGPSWRVTQDRSLFDYQPGESADGFHDPDFATRPVDVAALPEAARALAERLCAPLRDQGNQDAFAACVLDVAATGQAGFASTAQRAAATVLPPDLADRMAWTPPPVTTPGPVVPGGTVRDGDRVTGTVANPGDRNTYTLELADAVHFSLVDVEGDIEVTVSGGGDAAPRIIPGPHQYAVSAPGRYELTVVPRDGQSGAYGFRVVARRPRQFEVAPGDRIGAGGVPGTGRLDLPGRVDVYVVDPRGARRIELTEGTPCDDVTLGFSDTAEAPAVSTPSLVCWGVTSPELDGDGPVMVVVWSENGRTGDYSFGIEPAG